MPRRVGLGSIVLFSLSIAACRGAEAPELASRSAALISDAVHGAGTAGFYFLPPLVPQPAVQGVFSAGVEPTVVIDRVDASGAPLERVATFTMQTGPGSETLRLGAEGGHHYIVNWHTADFGLDPAATYRIGVDVPSGRLGFADVDVVGTGGQLRHVDRDEYVPLLNGRTLPIKFRIEQIAVDGDLDGVLDWLDVCPSVADPDQRDTDGDGRGDACECLGVTCVASDVCHLAGVCDPTTGACSDPEQADGTACDDGDPSTAITTCTAGLCDGPLGSQVLAELDLGPGASAGDAIDDGAIAYVPLGPEGMQCLHLGDPRAPRVLGAWSEPGLDCTSLVKIGDIVYAACGDAGVKCVNVADPSAPWLLGTIATGRTGQLARLGDALYVAIGDDVHVWDVSVPSAPRFVRSLGGAGTGSPIVRVRVDGRRVYCLYASGRLVVADAVDPFDPRVIGVLPGPPAATDLVVVGGIAWCAYDGAGLYAVDLRDPSAPVTLWHDGGSRTLRIAVRGGALACAYADGRVVTASIFDPRAPRVLTADRAPGGRTTGLSLLGDGLAWCAYGRGGSVLDLPPYVQAASPLDGSTGACAAGAEVELELSTAIDPGSVDADSFRVEREERDMPGVRAAIGRRLRFSPTATFGPGWYRTRLGRGLRNLRGTPAPREGFSSRFEIGAACIDWVSTPSPVIGGRRAELAWRVTPGAGASRVWIGTDGNPSSPLSTSLALPGTPGPSDFTASWLADDVSEPTRYAIVAEADGSPTLYAPLRWIEVLPNPCRSIQCGPASACREAGVCDPETGACGYAPVADGTGCDDGDACTQRDLCAAGACVGSAPVICPAADACHLEARCAPETGLCDRPVLADGTSCDDGDPRTELSSCAAGVCQGPLGSQILSELELAPDADARRVDEDERGFAFVAVGPAGLQALDTSDPAAPIVLGGWSQPGLDCSDVVVIGDVAYLSCGAAGIQCIRVASPGSPVRIGSLPGASGSLARFGNLIYAASGADVRIWDVTDPGAPVLVGTRADGGGVPLVRLVVDGGRLYCLYADGRLVISGLGSDGRAPSLLASLQGPGGATDLAVRGGLAWCAYDGAGLYVFDLSTPTSPVQLWWDGGSRTTGLALSRDGTGLACIYADGRFVTASFARPGSPRVLTASRGARPASGVAFLRGRFAWCAYGRTAAVLDLPPYVVMRSPHDGAAGLCGGAAAVDLYFSSEIDPSSVSESSVAVRRGGLAVEGLRQTEGRRVRFAATTLGVGDYEVEVGGEIRNLRGTRGPLDGDRSGFRVAPACLRWTSVPEQVQSGDSAELAWAVDGGTAAATRVLLGRDGDPSRPYSDVVELEGSSGPDHRAGWTVPSVEATTTWYALPVAEVASETLYGPVAAIQVSPAPPPPPPPPPTGSGVTWDPATAGANLALSDGNLSVSGTAGTCAGGVVATVSRSSGRWYWEATASRDGGVSNTNCPVISGVANASGARLGWYGYVGSFLYGSSGLTCNGPTSYVNDGDVVGVALDADAGNVRFYKNGSLVYDCGLPAGTWYPYANHCNDSSYHCRSTTNFGDAPFRYGPPAGYDILTLPPPGCPTGRAECDGQPATSCETDTTSDPSHCGACNLACAAGQSCVDGVCDFVNPGCGATTWPDLSGNGHTGTLAAVNRTASSGFVGAGDPVDPFAVALDGVDDRVELAPGADGLRRADEVSLETWVRLDVPSYATLYSNRDGTGQYSGLYLGTNGQTWWSLYSPGCGSWVINYGAPVTRSWTHLVSSFSRSTGRFTLYVNGVLLATSAATSICHGPGAAPRLGELGGAFPFRGRIGLFRIWAAGLDTGDVQELYRDGAPRFGVFAPPSTRVVTQPVAAAWDARGCAP